MFKHTAVGVAGQNRPNKAMPVRSAWIRQFKRVTMLFREKKMIYKHAKPGGFFWDAHFFSMVSNWREKL